MSLKYNTEKFRTEIALKNLKGAEETKQYVTGYLQRCLRRNKPESVANLILNDMPNRTHQQILLFNLLDFRHRENNALIIRKIFKQFFEKYKYFDLLSSHNVYGVTPFCGYYDQYNDKFYRYKGNKKILLTESDTKDFNLRLLQESDLISDPNVWSKEAFISIAIIINNDHEYNLLGTEDESIGQV